MPWSDIIGQNRVKSYFLHAFRADRLAHAYLFVGPEGTGKDAVALEIARIIHCEQRMDESCGVCPSCLRMHTMQHPDLRFVTPLPRGKDEGDDDGPLDKLPEDDVRLIQDQYRAKAADPYHRIALPRANVIKVNSIREVRRESPMTTTDHRKRIVVISQAERMNDEASNMLLKTLEEPSGETMLILTTAKGEQILPTIQSRCQVVRFDALSEDQIRRALMERRGVDPEEAAVKARLANGGYARAVDLLSEDLKNLREEVVDFASGALAHSFIPALDAIDRLAELKEKDAYRTFLLLLMMWCRDAMVLAEGGTVINQDQQQRIRKFLELYPTPDLPRVLGGIERALSLLDRNIHPKLLLINIVLLLRSAIPGTPMGHPGNLATTETS